MNRDLDFRTMLTGAAFVLFACVEPTIANHPAPHAAAVAGGKVAVETTYLAPDTCWRLADAGAGAPQGVSAPAGTLAAHVTVEHRGGACAQALNPLVSRFAIPDTVGAKAVAVYVTDPSQRILGAERTPIAR